MIAGQGTVDEDGTSVCETKAVSIILEPQESDGTIIIIKSVKSNPKISFSKVAMGKNALSSGAA